MNFVELCDAVQELYNGLENLIVMYMENRLYIAKINSIVIVVKAESYDDAKKKIHEALEKGSDSE